MHFPTCPEQFQINYFLHYYYHLVAASGRSSGWRCVRVVLNKNLKGCEVKGGYHRNIAQIKHYNPMTMLICYNLASSDSWRHCYHKIYWFFNNLFR